MDSIMSDNPYKCYLCGKVGRMEIHHVFPSGLRKKSGLYGLVIPLCWDCHQGPKGVHACRRKMDYCKAMGQIAFEKHYPGKSFMREFHRDYKHLLMEGLKP